MNGRYTKLKKRSRRGATLVFSVLLIGAVLAMAAFAVDVGYIVLVRTQLQVSADSAAMAAAAVNMDGSYDQVIAAAEQFAGRHVAGGENVELNPGDVEFGTWDFSNRVFTPSGSTGNAVRVTTRRDSTTNGNSPLFFSRVLGISSCPLRTEATAALVDNFTGFRPPSSGENLPLLPLAMDKATWDTLLDGNGTDNWTWDPESEEVTSGWDGVLEASLYPSSTGSPGNFGTVDVGSSNSSTADLARQILEGVSPQDLAHHGGELALDESGTLELGGDPGISAGMKDELAAIIGQPRMILLLSQVTGQGNNAEYTIVGFAGVRIVEVKLTGEAKDKRVVIQRANMVVRGGIPASDPTTRTSYFIYSPVSLVR